MINVIIGMKTTHSSVSQSMSQSVSQMLNKRKKIAVIFLFIKNVLLSINIIPAPVP